MDQSDLLAYLLLVLERQGLLYGIAGSHASMAFGEPRLTNDIDIVIDLNLGTLDPFCAAFCPRILCQTSGRKVRGDARRHVQYHSS